MYRFTLQGKPLINIQALIDIINITNFGKYNIKQYLFYKLLQKLVTDNKTTQNFRKTLN